MTLHAGPGWQQLALCRGPAASLFFPPSSIELPDRRAAREAEAKSICSRCPVQEQCLDEALRIREPHGIWGGCTEAERRELLARRAAV